MAASETTLFDSIVQHQLGQGRSPRAMQVLQPQKKSFVWWPPGTPILLSASCLPHSCTLNVTLDAGAGQSLSIGLSFCKHRVRKRNPQRNSNAWNLAAFGQHWSLTLRWHGGHCDLVQHMRHTFHRPGKRLSHSKSGPKLPVYQCAARRGVEGGVTWKVCACSASQALLYLSFKAWSTTSDSTLSMGGCVEWWLVTL